MNPRTRWPLAAALLTAGVVVTLIVAHQLAVRTIAARLAAALGPGARMTSIDVGWSAVEIRDLSIAAPEGWPTPDVLRARRVRIVIDVRSLWVQQPLRLARIVILDAELACLRQRDGQMRLLPDLPALQMPRSVEANTRVAEAGRPGDAAKGQMVPGLGTPLQIDAISIERARVTLFDESVRTPPYQLVLDGVSTELRDIRLPPGEGRIAFEASGAVAGAEAQSAAGSFRVKGWLEPGRGNSEIHTEVRGVSLRRLEPYLLKATETGVRSGTLDLDLDARVQGGHLDAPGTLTLDHLELAPAGHGLQTFMGLSRVAVIKAMEGRDGRIQTRFVLHGDLADPAFSLNEDLALRAGTGLAEALGVSVATLAESLGQAGQSSVTIAGKIVQGASGLAKRLVGE